jgi:peptidoglycan/LPS O-acetylase OafA/YrhL
MFWGGFFRYWYGDKKALIMVAKRNIQLKWVLYVLTIIVFMPALSVFLQGSITQDSHLLRLGRSYSLGLSMFIIGNLVFKIKNRFMVWIGTISYSLYLLHPVVLYSLFWYLKNKAPYWLMTLHLSVYIVFTMVFSMILSALVYYLVEKPAIDYAHKLTH